MTRAQVDARLVGRLMPSIFNNHCTVQTKTSVARDSVGQETETWANVPGLVDLPCTVAPVQRMTFNQEQRLAYATITDATHRILIVGDYGAQITTRMQLVIASQAYDILSVDVDSRGITTRLYTRIQTL